MTESATTDNQHSDEAQQSADEAALELIDYEEVMMVHMGEHRFLVQVSEAEEVVRPQVLTAVPMAPGHLLGVCNVHGLVVCIVDLPKVLNLKVKETDCPADRQRFVLYKHPRMKVGMKVDEVSQVFQVRKDRLPVSDGQHMIKGTIEIDGNSYRLLDLHVMFQ